MTPPQPKHTRPLTRRQRIALGIELYVPIARIPKPKLDPRPPLRVVPVPKPKETPPNLSMRERVELAERRDARAAWLKTVPLDTFRQWIQEDEKKLIDDHAREERESAEREWYAKTLDEMRRALGIRGRYYYSEDRKNGLYEYPMSSGAGN